MADRLTDDIAKLAQQELCIFLGPRPGRKSFAWLKSLRLTHCCTLLSEREDVRPIERICQKLDCSWVWLPIDGGRVDVLRQTDLAGHIRSLSKAVGGETPARVYFHCSAGIHRTGFFVYLLLRALGSKREDARAELARLRPVTAEQVGEERLSLADDLMTEFFSEQK